MAVREVDVIGQAMISTEKEIAGAAWGDEEPVLDESGDRTVETMGDGLEGQHEPDDGADEAEGEDAEGDEDAADGEGEAGDAEPEVKEPEGEDKPAVKPEGEREGRVPSGRLREATERVKAVETERDAFKAQLETVQTTAAQQIAALNARFDQMMVSLRQPPKPADGVTEAKPAVPDFFDDPAGFLAAQTKPLTDTVGQLREELAAQRVETSMAIAHSKHGDAFAKAFAALSNLNPKDPDDRSIVQRIYANPNSGEALVAWHKRNETLRQVGDDPTAYAEKIRNETRDALLKDPEVRRQIIDAARAEASGGPDGKPNTITRLPKSLNGAAGGNRRDATTVEFDDNDSAIAAAAWR